MYKKIKGAGKITDFTIQPDTPGQSLLIYRGLIMFIGWKVKLT
jgi:hypothetical protein